MLNLILANSYLIPVEKFIVKQNMKCCAKKGLQKYHTGSVETLEQIHCQCTSIWDNFFHTPTS